MHMVQDVAPEVTPAVEKPAPQTSQFSCPVLPWYRPFVHSVQLLAFEAFCAVPAAQLVHSLEPVALLYLPLVQSVQVDAAEPA